MSAVDTENTVNTSEENEDFGNKINERYGMAAPTIRKSLDTDRADKARVLRFGYRVSVRISIR